MFVSSEIDVRKGTWKLSGNTDMVGHPEMKACEAC